MSEKTPNTTQTKPKQKKQFVIPNKVWLLLSLAVALVLWYLLSIGKTTSRSFPFLPGIIQGIQTMMSRGVFWYDLRSSLISIGLGFCLGFVTAVPVAFLMAWYMPVRKIVEPWINFLRNIPALAYAPLIVLALGVGRVPQVTLIWLCTFLTMSIVVFNGIRNIDNTLVKAARVLGANDMDIFFRITLPATVPYILTAIRLGLSAGLTTLLAAESTGSTYGLGMRIRSLQATFESKPMLAYILIIGIIGMILNSGTNFIERKLTSWQERRETE